MQLERASLASGIFWIKLRRYIRRELWRTRDVCRHRRKLQHPQDFFRAHPVLRANQRA